MVISNEAATNSFSMYLIDKFQEKSNAGVVLETFHT